MIQLKSREEIELIRESSRTVAEVLKVLEARIQPGVTTGELDRLAEDYIRSTGGVPANKGYGWDKNNLYPATLCVSIDSEVVHGIPGNRVLKEGEIISLDVGVKKNGFFGDGAWTYPVGIVSEEKQRLMDVTRESLYLGIEQAVDGHHVHDISYAVQQYVESHGFSVVRDLVGHGVGKQYHEEPSVPNYGKKGTGVLLHNGMTIAIEPMVNIGTWHVNIADDGWTVYTTDGKASAHFEHTVAIIDGKAEIMTQL